MIRLIATLIIGILLIILVNILTLPFYNNVIQRLLLQLPSDSSNPYANTFTLWKNFANFIIGNYFWIAMLLVAGAFLLYYSVRGD
ncbi:MAG: hypothetical protein QXT65_04585 [Candidatus Nitrosocaldaceae archaeon]